MSFICGLNDYEAAGRFYNYYTLVRGFSTRKSKKDKYRNHDLVYRRQLCCSKAGFNSRKQPNPFEFHVMNEGVNVKKKKKQTAKGQVA